MTALARLHEPRGSTVCRLDDLAPERGAAALVGGDQVALFRTYDGTRATPSSSSTRSAART